MNRFLKFLSVFVGFGFLLTLPLSQTAAQEENQRFRFQYAAQFICGFDPPVAFLRVVPGRYATAVNILNPNRTPVAFRKGASLTFPPAAQEGGAVSEFQIDALEPNQALMVDCEEIPGFFDSPPGTPYFQGYVVIQSLRPLEVNATYTAGSPGNGADVPPVVNSIVVQEITEKRVR